MKPKNIEIKENLRKTIKNGVQLNCLGAKPNPKSVYMTSI